MSILMILFSCNNEDDSTNTIYKEKYERRFIIFEDSLGGVVQDSGIVKVSKRNTGFTYEFVTINNKKIDAIENIEMEMTGSNSLRNVNWTPVKFIIMNKDSINISYQDKNRKWFVNAIK